MSLGGGLSSGGSPERGNTGGGRRGGWPENTGQHGRSVLGGRPKRYWAKAMMNDGGIRASYPDAPDASRRFLLLCSLKVVRLRGTPVPRCSARAGGR